MPGSPTRIQALLLVALPLLAGCASGSSGGSAQASTPTAAAEDDADAIAVRVAPVRHESLSELYSTSATLRADKRATVTARTTGVLTEILVEEGDRVEANQPLARLEDDEQRITFERARTSRDTLQRDFQRARALHEQGLVSDEEFETVRREWEDADHAASLAELELSRTVIRSPFAGVVVTRHLDPGVTVSPGMDVYDIADLDPLYADVNIPERHVLDLSAGQQVRLTADASGATRTARIERIAPAVDPETGTVKVTLAVESAGDLRPGAFVRADIVTDTHDNATVVPRPALVAEGRRWHLFRLVDGDRVAQVEVRLGYEEGERVEIAEVVGAPGRLEAGSPIVVAGAPALSDGARVRVIEP